MPMKGNNYTQYKKLFCDWTDKKNFFDALYDY